MQRSVVVVRRTVSDDNLAIKDLGANKVEMNLLERTWIVYIGSFCCTCRGLIEYFTTKRRLRARV